MGRARFNCSLSLHGQAPAQKVREERKEEEPGSCSWRCGSPRCSGDYAPAHHERVGAVGSMSTSRWPPGTKVEGRPVAGAFVEVGVGDTWAFAVKAVQSSSRLTQRPGRRRLRSLARQVPRRLPDRGLHSRICLRAMGRPGADRARCAATALLLRGQSTLQLRRRVRQTDHWPAAQIRCRETLCELGQSRRRRCLHQESPANSRRASLRPIAVEMRWLAVSRVRRPMMVCSSAIRGRRREPDRLAPDGIRTETA